MKIYVAGTLLLIGAAMTIAAPFLPQFYPQEKLWSQEEAEEHSVAAATLHKASHDAVFVETVDERASQEDIIQAKQALEAAEARFDRSKERLENAQFWQNGFPKYLRIGGCVVAVIGLLIYAAERGKAE